MLTDLLTGFISFAATISIVAAVPLWASSWARKRAWILLPPALAAALLMFATVSGLTSRLWPFDAGGWIARTMLSCAVMAAFLKLWRSELSAISGRTRGDVTLLLFLSFVALLPTAYIQLSQHWEGALYVRSPFQLDPVRNTDLVAALARGSRTLFLPDTKIVYQLLWYYGAADVFGILPVPTVTRWYTVQGMTLATGWFFNLVVLWSVYLCGASRRHLWWVYLFASVVLACDVSAMPLLNALGARSTSSSSIAFEYFSPLIMTLSAPQHTMCMILLVVAIALYVHRREYSPAATAEGLRGGQIGLFSGAIVASPVLGAMFFPAYYIARLLDDLLRRARSALDTAIEAALVAGIAIVAMPAITRVSFKEFFFRGNAIRPTGILLGLPTAHQSVAWAPIEILGWLALPFLVSFALLATYAATGRLQERLRPVLVLNLAMLLGFFFWNYLFTDVELRRHFSIVAVSVIFITSALTFVMVDGSSRPLLITTALIAALGSVGAGLWFIRDTTVLPSTVATDLPLSDYFCINRYLRQTHNPPKGIIAASGDGIVLSVVNEEATALAPREAILVHQKTGATLREKLQASGSAKGAFDALSPALIKTLRSIGFDAFVWGPVEEHEWGPQKEALFKDAQLVFECRSVGFYRFSKR